MKVRNCGNTNAEYISRPRTMVIQTKEEFWKSYGTIYRKETDMKVGDIYVSEGKSLKAEDLQGKARKLQIESYDTVEFDGATKIVLLFSGAKKGLILNVTNANRIAVNLGTDEIDNWIGKAVTIYPTTTEFGGKQVDCIRVKEEMPEIVAVEGPDDTIPF